MNYAIVAATGKKRHGKTYFCNALEHEIDKYCQGAITVCRINFKDELVDEAEALGWNGVKDKRGRKLLQLLGTDCVRECIDQNHWVRKWFNRFEEQISANRAISKIVLVDDVRFDNEAYMVKALGGQIVKIVTPSRLSSDTHSSENGIDRHLVDYSLELEIGFDYISAAAEQYFKQHFIDTLVIQEMTAKDPLV